MTTKIILKDTQLGQNVGMVARVMLNFNLTELGLLTPLEDASNLDNAYNASCKALDEINVKIYDKMDDILNHTNIIYAFSARKRYLKIPQISIYEMFDDVFFKASKRAILFGGEKSGLSNEDISYANYLVYIPTNPNFSSLNLAQAVGLFAYELSKHKHIKDLANTKIINHKIENEDKKLDLAKLNFFYEDLFDKLQDSNFFSNLQRAEITKQNIKALYSKLQLDNQELDTLIAIHKMLYGMKK